MNIEEIYERAKAKAIGEPVASFDPSKILVDDAGRVYIALRDIIEALK